MALDTTVTPATIAVALGQAAPDSGSITEQRYYMWIQDAVMLIERRRDSIDETLVLDQAVLDYVIREAVTTHAQRPDDATQVSVSLDDGSMSKTYRSAKGRVTILDDWWSLLGLIDQGGGAYSIDTARGTTTHLPWCSLTLGANYCSCGVDIAGYPIYEGGVDW